MFDIGLKQHSLERTLEDVRGIAQVFAHRKLAYLLREPNVPAQRKETAIRQALANKLLPTSLNLALLVVQRELVDIMPNIANELEQLVLNYKNEAIADVTTATRIDDAELTQIKQALEKRTGKTIITHARVQPDILGGLIARVGDQIIDGSVRSRLAALRQQLLKSALSSGINLPFEVGSEGQATAADGAKRSPQQDTVESSKIQ
jgi:F-type H+-transporting ATPase subunit delta